MKNILLLILASAFTQSAISSVPVDFEKIKHWTGSGTNRAALVITNDAGASDPHVYVWGYRWNDCDSPTGETMFRAICANSSELVLLTQLTGTYGSTVCGIGFGNTDELLKNIYFDFDMARNYEFINFDYYNTSPFFGQTESPGDNSPIIAAKAIEQALTTGSHVIDHPFNHAAYGYPAYDYDCWFLKDGTHDNGWWSSAWYTGYWSYWTATANSDEWMYSGTGFSGRQLRDGDIDAWSFTMFENPKIGGFGEGTPPSDNQEFYSYRPASVSTSVRETVDDTEVWYDLSGHPVSPCHLSSGMYVKRHGKTTEKVFIQ